MSAPRNIIMVVADSLRYDSVYQAETPDLPHGLPFISQNATRFTQARSAGCWTLPATASMFTGLMPHEHGATAQTRGVNPDAPTLAERLAEAGYATHQITANVATTHIFGLDRGFQEVRRIWKHVPAQHKKIHEALVLVGKPRLRKRIFSKDFVVGKMSEDLEASKVWLQRTWPTVFDQTRSVVEEDNRKGKRSFCFLNLMEAHFPYHVGPSFQTTAESFLGRLKEIYSLYHLVNQTWLKDDQKYISQEMLDRLRERQRQAWRDMAPAVDAFVEEMASDPDNLVIFCADHGDNFGEQGWLYHFSNVTDAGNRVPIFYLGPGQRSSRIIHQPVSARHLYDSILKDAGAPVAGPHLCEEPDRSTPVMQAYWYNNQGLTLPKYRFNQFGFMENGMRYVHRRGAWYSAPPQAHEEEPRFRPLPSDTDPVRDLPMDPERKRQLGRILNDYRAFSATISA